MPHSETYPDTKHRYNRGELMNVHVAITDSDFNEVDKIENAIYIVFTTTDRKVAEALDKITTGANVTDNKNEFHYQAYRLI